MQSARETPRTDEAHEQHDRQSASHEVADHSAERRPRHAGAGEHQRHARGDFRRALDRRGGELEAHAPERLEHRGDFHHRLAEQRDRDGPDRPQQSVGPVGAGERPGEGEEAARDREAEQKLQPHPVGDDRRHAGTVASMLGHEARHRRRYPEVHREQDEASDSEGQRVDAEPVRAEPPREEEREPRREGRADDLRQQRIDRIPANRAAGAWGCQRRRGLAHPRL